MLERPNWLWFRRDEPKTIDEWEKTTGESLGRVLGLGHALKVTLRLPSVEQAASAWEGNLDLLGEIRIAEPHGDLGERLKIHLPIDGVFIASGSVDNKPQSKVWDSWLGERPGVRLIKPIGKKASESADGWWRIGFPDGSHLECRSEDASVGTNADAKEDEKRQAIFSRRVKFALAMCPDAYPDGLREEFAKEKICENEVRDWCRNNVEVIRNWTKETVSGETLSLAGVKSASEFNGITDRDDLNYRPLITFPVWLRQRLCRRFWNARMSFDRRNAQEDAERADFNWRDQELLQRVAVGLVPLRESTKNKKKLTGLSAIAAENPLELTSRISGVKRFRVNRDDALTYSVDYRQNHASFNGRLCPIESPESEMVGISLQLARGARIDSNGMILPTLSAKVLDRAGWGVAMIPFSHHNDGARNMMGAKNLRQLLPVRGAERPCVRTGVEDELLRLTANLSRIGVCPDCADAQGHFAVGKDLLVAYMPWYGWNVDDAVVVSDSIVSAMTVTKRKVFSRFVTPGWDVEVGNVAAGDVIKHGDVIARLKGPDGEPVQLQYLDADDARMVKSPSFPPESMRSESVSYRLEYIIEKDFPLASGDKLMGRHGNKGVVSRVVACDEMPRLPKEGEPGADGLPENMRGRHVDILLNPHGVISRMNPSQLLETHLGWLIKNGIEEVSGFFKSDGDAVGIPEVGLIDHEKVKMLLKESGLDNTGKISLYFKDGSNTKQPVVVGYQHFVRLNHIPSLKSQARRGGRGASYSMSTLQAKHGRRLGGGQRLGEMEVWALAAHQADAVLEEMLGPKSNMALACEWENPDRVPHGAFMDGFPAVMRDWLRAMMIGFSADAVTQTAKAEILSDVGAEMGDSQKVHADGGVDVWKTVEYGCDGKGWPECDNCIMRHMRCRNMIMSTTGVSHGLTVASLLDSYGVFLDGSLVDEGNGMYSQTVKASASLEARGSLKLQRIGNGKSDVKFQLSFDEVKICGFPDAVKSVCAYYHSKAESKLANLVSGRDSLGDFYVSCSRRQSDILYPKKGAKIGEKIIAEPGGLYDEHIFGPFDSPTSDCARDKWGWIAMPEGACVHFPIWLFMSDKAAKALLAKVAAGDEDSLIAIRSIPVLPLRYRYPVRCARGFRFDKIDTKGYQPILAEIRAYEKSDPTLRNPDAIQNAVDRYVSLLLKKFCGKEGLLRHCGLGRRVDRSMRMVITPNPEIAWDEVRVPYSILWEVMGDLVCKEKNREDLLEGGRQCGIGWSWPRSENDYSKTQARKLLLKEYLNDHEEGGDPIYLLLNRQPSLHRDSFQAFRVGLLDNECGSSEVFQISPLCCKGFGADFDGDEMVGHLPVSRSARLAAKKMSPTETLLSNGMVLVDGVNESIIHGAMPLANFDRDFVSGEYLRTKLPVANFKAEVQKKFGLLSADDIANMSKKDFKLVTENGLSFGYYDLCDLRRRVRGGGKWYEGDANGEPHLPIEIIVKTHANGSKQIEQLVNRRGRLSACDRPIDVSLTDGMSWQDIFDASWNARTTMCDKKLGTGKAGDLTRKLVLALWGINIEDEKCGLADADRKDGLSILRCKASHGICAACYNCGKPYGAADVARGFPAGLVAALSLGERGTQLSMKGAQTSGVEVDIGDAKALLLRGQFPAGKKHDAENEKLRKSKMLEGWPLFLKAITEPESRKYTPYHEVDERHLQVVWRTLHSGAPRPDGSERSKNESGKNEIHALSGLYSDVVAMKIAASRQKETIGKLINTSFSVGYPIGAVMFNLFGSRK